MKRKVAANGDTKATKRSKANNGASKPKDFQSVTKLKFETPQELIASLIGSVSFDTFLAEYWEKKPLHVQRGDARFYGECFTLQSLYSIVENHDLRYDADLNVCRYVDGTKEVLNPDGKATLAEMKDLFEKEAATIQFHQPQRFSKELWFIMEKMEAFFGNLVGANVYLTPPGATGLAPHYDDVEVFIIQVEGSKKWKLYAPHVELAASCSEDLKEKDIGTPTHNITMEPGDMLYFPRGTIHHAEAMDQHSTHITISTYQHNTWGEFLSTAITNAVDVAMEKDVKFRRGLPINYISFLGKCLTEKRLNQVVSDKDDTPADEKKAKPVANDDDKRIVSFKETLKNLMSDLIDHIDPHSCADILSEDFVASRLPPIRNQDLEASEEGPSLESTIQMRHPQHMRLVICDNEESSSEEEEEDESDEEMEDDEVEKSPKGKPSPKQKSPKGQSAASKRGRPKRNSSKDSSSEEPKDDDDSEDDDDDEEFCIDGPFVKLCHSLNNEQAEHMVGEEKQPAGIKFGMNFGKAIQLLLGKADVFTPVDELPLSDEDKLHLVTSLWSEGLVNVATKKDN